MKLHFATILAREPGSAASELNAFLARHRVVGAEKHLVGEPGSARPGWMRTRESSPFVCDLSRSRS